MRSGPRSSGQSGHETRGVSDPARRRFCYSDGRQAGSLTPLSARTSLFSTRPGRQKAPADADATSAQVPPDVRVLGTSLPHTDDRRARHRRDGTGRRGGRWPAAYGSPSSAPLSCASTSRESNQGRRKGPAVSKVVDAEQTAARRGPAGVTMAVNAIAASPAGAALRLSERPLERREPWSAWHGFARLLLGPVASRRRRDFELPAGPQQVDGRHAESTRDLRHGL